MPELCRFYGIVITMYPEDHSPPHFHARYETYSAVFEIRNGRILKGNLPPNAKRLVKDWFRLHKKELEENWKMLQSKKASFKKIDPLDG